MTRSQETTGLILDALVSSPVIRHHGRAHGGQVDDRRDTGEVLEDDPPGNERDLNLADRHCVVNGEGAHVGFGHQVAVEMAQRRLEQNLDRVGEAINVSEGIESVDGALTERSGDPLGGTEGVKGHA